MKRRLLSMVLALAMVLTMVNVPGQTVNAEESTVEQSENSESEIEDDSMDQTAVVTENDAKAADQTIVETENDAESSDEIDLASEEKEIVEISAEAEETQDDQDGKYLITFWEIDEDGNESQIDYCRAQSSDLYNVWNTIYTDSDGLAPTSALKPYISTLLYFVGWSKNPEGTEIVTDETVYTEDTKLYAITKEKEMAPHISFNTESLVAGTSMIVNLTEALGDSTEYAYSLYNSQNQYNDICEYDAEGNYVTKYPLGTYYESYKKEEADTYVYKASTEYCINVKLCAANGYYFDTTETTVEDFDWNGMHPIKVTFDQGSGAGFKAESGPRAQYADLFFRFTTPSYEALPDDTEIEINAEDLINGKVPAGTLVSGDDAEGVFASRDCSIRTKSWTDYETHEEVTTVQPDSYYRVILQCMFDNELYDGYGYGFTNQTNVTVPGRAVLEHVFPNDDGTADIWLIIPSEGGSYSINANATTGGSVELSETKANRGDEVTVTVRPDDGYYLSGYTAKQEDADTGYFAFTKDGTDDNGDILFTLYVDDADVTLDFTFAQQKRSIIYCNASGNSLTTKTVVYGSSVTLAKALTKKSGYKQAGWSVKSDGSSIDYMVGQTITVTKNLRLYPYYEEIDTNYFTEAPTFDTEAGTYDSPIYLTLSCDNSDADIYYTTDGSDPVTSETAEKYDRLGAQVSNLYRINVNQSMTIKAVAEDDGTYSGVVTADYVITTKIIRSACFEITEPTAGGTVSNTITSDDPDKYFATVDGSEAEVSDLGWYTSSGTAVAEGSKFASGTHYYFDFYVARTVNTDVLASNGDMAVYVNGYPAIYYSGSTNYIQYRVYYFNVAAENGKVLNAAGKEVDYINPSAPVILQADAVEGKAFSSWQTPTFDTVSGVDSDGKAVYTTRYLFTFDDAESANTQTSYAHWNKSTKLPSVYGSTMTFTAEFAGEPYNLDVQNGTCDTTAPRKGDTITVMADKKKGQVFVGWTATGVELDASQASSGEMSFEMPGQDVTLTANYASVIDSANVLVSVPKAGKTPENATTTDGSFYVVSTEWSPSDAVFETTGSEEDDSLTVKSYMVTARLETEDGYQFSDATAFYVDGMKATIVNCTKTTAIVKYTFTDGILTKNIENMSVKLSYTSYVYSGSAKKPSVTISGLTKGTDYTVTYSNNIKVGTAKVTITGIGGYIGSITKTYKIIPKTAAIKTLTSGSRKLTVKTTCKPTTAGGAAYQIAYKQKGTSKWKYTTTTSYYKTLSKLTKGKYYYVKVRTYKKVSGKTYYGAWSKTKLSKKIK